MKKIYHWDAVTMVFVRESDARLDVPESKASGGEVYLLPACATFEPPPDVGEGVVAVWDKKISRWITALDYRGVPLYSTETGEVTTTTHIGRVPDGMTELAPLDGVPCVWAGTGWVEDVEAIAESARAEKAATLEACSPGMVRAMVTMFRAGVDKGLWTEEDFPADVVSAVTTADALIKEIDGAGAA